MGSLDDFFARLSHVLKEDKRFKEDAYLFVMAGLGRASRKLSSPRHLTGGELLVGLREEAGDQFGPMAVDVLQHWGVKNSLDFGRIVFNMVAQGILSKTEKDRLEDFEDPQFFERLFDGRAEYRLVEKRSTGKKAARTPNSIKKEVSNG